MQEFSETSIWEKYQKGKDHHQRLDMYNQVERCHRFMEGDQWQGVKAGGEALPVVNFIKPICRYKINMVAMNEMAIIYSSLSGDEEVQSLCQELTRFAASQGEKAKLETVKWQLTKNACITGDHYVYFYDAAKHTDSVAGEGGMKLATRGISKEDIYFADEENPDIQQQEWIIIAERLPVDKVRRRAKENHLTGGQLELIVADEDLETGRDVSREMGSGKDKLTSLLYLHKTEKGVEFCRSTRAVVYEPMTLVDGLTRYPIAGMRWEEKHKSARGIGVVEGLIPNQIEVNKTKARRVLCAKKNSYPMKVVDSKKVKNPKALDQVGATILVDNAMGNPIQSMVGYLSPASIGPDAAQLEAELVSQSRELEGASEAATGQVDPTKASGEAIKAARDQSALALNEQTGLYKQCMEDIAYILLDMLRVYSRDGFHPRYQNEDGQTMTADFSPDLLKSAEIDIRVDVCPIDPYSVLSREMALENALAHGHITFPEYVAALDKNSGVPKEKFEAILNKRHSPEELARVLGNYSPQEVMAVLQQMQAQPPTQGGMEDGMQNLPM